MKPVERSVLSRQLHEELREALMLGDLRPGDRLTFRDVASRFHTSVTPVREALLQLVAEGLLEASPGRTIRVPTLTRSKFIELRDIRILLEGPATEIAAARGGAALAARMREAYDTLIRSHRSRNPAEAIRAHRAFHFTLYEGTGMPALVNLISNVWVSTSPYVIFLYQDPESGFLRRSPDRPRRPSVDEHRKVVEALEAGDPAAARAAVERDIPNREEIIFKYLVPDPSAAPDRSSADRGPQVRTARGAVPSL
jgi:DNA-binding GntR family transcriptional regulator